MKIILSLHENNSKKRISSSLCHTVRLLSKHGERVIKRPIRSAQKSKE